MRRILGPVYFIFAKKPIFYMAILPKPETQVLGTQSITNTNTYCFKPLLCSIFSFGTILYSYLLPKLSEVSFHPLDRLVINHQILPLQQSRFHDCPMKIQKIFFRKYFFRNKNKATSSVAL